MKNINVKLKVIFSEGIKMIEFNKLSWETFTRTGDIEAYLLYRTINNLEMQEEKDDKWHKSEQEALS